MARLAAQLAAARELEAERDGLVLQLQSFVGSFSGKAAPAEGGSSSSGGDDVIAEATARANGVLREADDAWAAFDKARHALLGVQRGSPLALSAATAAMGGLQESHANWQRLAAEESPARAALMTIARIQAVNGKLRSINTQC